MSDRAGSPAPDPAEPAPRQRIERMPGARRARLTPAPGTIAEPAPDALPTADDELTVGAVTSGGAETSGPNDDRLRRDVPPHY